jgi:malate dehydrogenase
MYCPTTLTVCVTGAAGQIGYAFIPLLLTGQVFGPATKINLRLLDIPQCENVLKGVILEIEDGAYPLLNSVESGSDPKVLFRDIDVGVFIGGFPRKQGMERKELLSLNGKIFKSQGEALNEVAKPTCRIIVVANPANTNCLLLQSNCPKIPKENFTCLTRLDHNRALSQLALKAGVHSTTVKNAIIWGNHSSTQYPDVNHGCIGGKPIREVIKDDAYLNKDFIERVQKRGAEIIAARNGSSVFSAANAVKDHLNNWYLGGNPGEWVSMGLISQGEYGIPKDICFSFPVVCKGKWVYEIVQGLKWDEFSVEKIKITTQELEDEKKEAFA